MLNERMVKSSKVAMLKSLRNKLCEISNVYYEAHSWMGLNLE